MNWFQRTVLIIATVILILSLIVLGILLWNSRNELQYPPEVGNCPDYFVMRKKQGQDMCYNQQGLGNAHSQDCTWGDFKDQSKREKKAWATKCGVTWDGITNI